MKEKNDGSLEKLKKNPEICAPQIKKYIQIEYVEYLIVMSETPIRSKDKISLEYLKRNNFEYAAILHPKGASNQMLILHLLHSRCTERVFFHESCEYFCHATIERDLYLFMSQYCIYEYA